MKKLLLALVVTTFSIFAQAENCYKQYNVLESLAAKRLTTTSIVQHYWDISADILTVGEQLLRASQYGAPARDPRGIEYDLSRPYAKIKSVRDHAYVYSTEVVKAYDSLLECSKVTPCSAQVNNSKATFNQWVSYLKFSVDYHFANAEKAMNELKAANLAAYNAGGNVPYFESYNLKVEGENLPYASNEMRGIFDSSNTNLQNSFNGIKSCLYL